MTTGTLPPPAEIEFGRVFSASWRLFLRNWIVALPPILAGIVCFVVFVAFVIVLIAAVGVAAFRHGVGAHASAPVSGGLIGGIILGVIALIVLVTVLALWSETAMYGMADAAWERGTASLGDGFAAFRARAGAVFVAAIGVLGLALVALIIALPTLFLSLMALPLVTLFVMPAAVGGRRDGFDAISESFRLLRGFFVPSIVTWLVLYAIQYGISMLSIFAIVPLQFSVLSGGLDAPPTLPPLPLLAFSGATYFVTLVALLAYNGFRAIVQVGLFREIEAHRTAAFATAPGAALPPA